MWLALLTFLTLVFTFLHHRVLLLYNIGGVQMIRTDYQQALGEAGFTDKAGQESLIANKWLNRAKRYLESENNSALFQEALASVAVSSTSDDISLSEFVAFLRFVRRQYPEATLKLLQQATLMDLGVLGYAVASSGTLGRALETMRRFHELTSERYNIDIEHAEGFVRLRPVAHFEYLSEYVDIAEDCLLGMLRALQQLAEGTGLMSETRACFAYQVPQYADVYLEVFPCQCSFDCKQTELVFPDHWLDLPLSSANPIIAELSTGMCNRIFGENIRNMRADDAIRRLLIHRRGTHVMRLEETAELLRLSPNQLRKRVYRLGTTYKKIVLEVRMALAKHYIEATALSIQEIAYLLDYSQAAPFSRAYKSYYGWSPQQQRLAVQKRNDSSREIYG
jgi:AraC-like DNA-binding protein